MIQLCLLLLGREVVQRRWYLVAAAGAAWGLLGLSIFLDALDGVTLIPTRGFGYLLLVEGLVSLAAVLGSRGTAKRLRLVKAAVMMTAAGLIVLSHTSSHFLLAMMFGTAFLLDGGIRIASALVVRLPGWRGVLAGGVVAILLAVATLQPWPTWYRGTIACNVGLFLLLSGIAVVRLGLRLRRLAPDAPLSSLLGRGAEVSFPPTDPRLPGVPAGALVVHVWTPTGTPATPVRRRMIERYIAAMDADGAISTGHAALEMEEVYISHYPAVEIDRSPGDFTRVLRATAENNVPGRFQPDYATEAAGWTGSTARVVVRGFDPARLRAFWAAYRQDRTYNLTRRNCSTAVANALDAALEGALRRQDHTWRRLARAVVSPELWAATLLRERAETMTWTPGLVLDYARAMSAVIDPPPSAWGALRQHLAERWARRGVGHGPRHGPQHDMGHDMGHSLGHDAERGVPPGARSDAERGRTG